MHLEYSVSRKETNSITRSISSAVWRRRDNRKLKYLLQGVNVLLWIPVGLFVSYSYGQRGTEIGHWVLCGMGITIVAVWLYRLLERNALCKFPAEPGSVFGPQKLTADATGVTVETSDTLSHTKWSGINCIERSGGYVLIFIDNHSAHYIPNRAIGGEAEVDKFIAELNALKMGKDSRAG